MKAMRTRMLLVVSAAVLGLLVLHVLAPDYLLARGFPLDDAWIHSVYARELAQSGMLAYNPGEPATGATSLLWPVLLAPMHALAPSVGAYVFLAKLLGFSLHVLTAIFVLRLGAAAGIGDRSALVAAILVAWHPDLLAASVSGMEVPLATAIAVLAVHAVHFRGATWMAIVASLAYLARPELVVVCVVLPALAWLPGQRRRWLGTQVAAIGGAALAVAGTGLRNLLVSGLPLPATFYAKVPSDASDPFEKLRHGFGALMNELPVVDSGLLVLAMVVYVAVTFVRHRERTGIDRIDAIVFAVGLSYCATSFILIAPSDPYAFYHQRYILPALPSLIAPLAWLAGRLLQRMPERRAAAIAAAALVLVVAAYGVDAPRRFAHLENDAHNIDDVQVALGKHLAQERDALIWTVDAGAVRYFAGGVVVDTLGLNTPALLRSDRERFATEHRPTHLVVVPGWSRVVSSTSGLAGKGFSPTTPYTVTSMPAMSTHYLAPCKPGVQGVLSVRGRALGFRCAGEGTDGEEP